VVAVASSKGAIRIEGIVRPCFLDAICLSHRVCVVATDGRVYEVEPNYVGLYMERFVGHHVVAQVVPVTNGKRRSVVRILSLKVLDRTPMDAKTGTEDVTAPPQAEDQDQVLCELKIGGTTS
jgi:hypothetical protein